MMLAIERLAHRLIFSEKCIMNSLFLPIISIDNQMMSCDNSNLFTFEQLGTHTYTFEAESESPFDRRSTLSLQAKIGEEERKKKPQNKI